MEQRVHKTILLTPLEAPPGVTVRRVIGLASSVVTGKIPPHVELRAFIGKGDAVGEYISDLIHACLLSLEKKASKMGGNAVLGLRMEITHLGWGRISVMMYGTVAEVE